MIEVMNRRTFLATAGAAVIAPALSSQAAPIIGMDLAAGPDQTVYRLLAIQDGAIREVHRVTGVPRYQMGRDTWQDQADATGKVVLQRLPDGDDTKQ